MSDLMASIGPSAVEIEFDELLYPKDAIYGAAYVFIDRCYVRLDRVDDARIKVTLRDKRGELGDGSGAALAGDFENELLGQAWRHRIAEQNRQLVENVTARALAGASGPPGLDELLEMDIDEGSAFDDPLGIAMSWEEKYKKKADASEPGVEGPGPAAPPAGGEEGP